MQLQSSASFSGEGKYWMCNVHGVPHSSDGRANSGVFMLLEELVFFLEGEVVAFYRDIISDLKVVRIVQNSYSLHPDFPTISILPHLLISFSLFK